MAEAIVLSFEGRTDEAVARFGGALEALSHFGLRADEADGLHQWGLALARAGDRAGADAKLGSAAEIYRGHGAGVAWTQRIERDRRREGVR